MFFICTVDNFTKLKLVNCPELSSKWWCWCGAGVNELLFRRSTTGGGEQPAAAARRWLQQSVAKCYVTADIVTELLFQIAKKCLLLSCESPLFTSR